MKAFLFLLIATFLTFKAQAQQFNTSITVNTPKLQTADPKLFKTLEGAIKELMNSRNWVEDVYESSELIELNIIITIDKENANNFDFSGQLMIQASRPVYNSGYNTIIFQTLDKDFNFNYKEFDVLDFTENSYTTNLASTLGFYAHIILGMDKDSFSELGGDEYINKAQAILSLVPRGINESAWSSRSGSTKKNRYWLVENLLNPRMQNMRRAMYKYHMLGLDQLSNTEKRLEGLNNIFEAVTTVRTTGQSNPGSMWVGIFADSKRNEIISVFEITDVLTKRNVYNNMVKIDGSNAKRYAPLLK
jgi:hypothetical protein